MRRLSGFPGVILAAVVAGALVVGGSAAAQPDDPHDDYKRVQARLKQTGVALDGATQRAADAVARFQATAAALPAAEDRVAQAKGTVVAASVQADTAARRASEATGAQRAAEGVLDQKTAEVAAAREHLSAFASAAYTGSAVAEFNMLLEIRSPQDMIQRVGYLQHIAESQNAAIDRAHQARLAARGAANEAELARRRAVQAQQTAQVQLAAAQSAQREAAAAQAALQSLIVDRKAAAADANAERGS